MPAKLKDLLTTRNLIFGDFTVVPLSKEEAGVMRMVRVVAAENIVVTDLDLQFVDRIPGIVEGDPDMALRKQKEAEMVVTPEAEYIVRSGDTLNGISRRFGVSVESLLELNPWLSDLPPRIGSRLKLK